MSAQTIRRGDGKVLRVPVLNPDGTAFDLTGTAEIGFALARRLGAATSVAKTLTGGGIAIADAAGGIVEVTLDGEDTEELQPGAYYFEIQLVDGDGAATTLEFSTARILIEADQIAP